MRATCGENGAAALKAEAALSDSRSEGGASERPAAWGSRVLWHKQAGKPGRKGCESNASGRKGRGFALGHLRAAFAFCHNLCPWLILALEGTAEPQPGTKDPLYTQGSQSLRVTLTPSSARAERKLGCHVRRQRPGRQLTETDDL